MKLTNPTDAELNAAFAEKVAGWKPSEQEIEAWQTWAKISGCNTSRDNAISTAKICDRPHYTTSADAVLPWLEKWEHSSVSWLRNRKDQGDQWEVKLFDKAWEHGYFGRSNTFPKSAVIALIRAHGVEMEFT